MSMSTNPPADHSSDLVEDLEPTAGMAARKTGGSDKPYRPISRLRLVWRRLRKKPNFYIGGVIVAIIVLFALFGDFFNIYEQGQQDPYNFNSPPNSQHFFGTDAIGVDLYASMTSALRKSLLIGFIAAPISTLIAAFMGSLAGYLGGWFELMTNTLVNLLLVLPVFYVLMIVSPALQSPETLPEALQWLGFLPPWMMLVIAIGFFSWMIMAQIVKNQTKSLKEREYVMASRYMGVGTLTILRRHVIPNVSSLLIIDGTLAVAGAILAETSLSFFGLGIQAPDVSLGTLLQDGQSAAASRPWLFIIPAGFLVLLLTGVALMGDALRDAIDPTSEVNRA